MRALVLAIVLAVQAVGCSNTPTAPSPVNAAAVLTEQEAKPAPVSEITIRLYFLCNQMEGRRPVGMPVDVWWASGPWTSDNPLVLTVSSRGSVSFVVPHSVTKVYWRTHEWMGVCPDEGEVALPGSIKSIWNHSISLSHVECGTGM